MRTRNTTKVTVYLLLAVLLTTLLAACGDSTATPASTSATTAASGAATTAATGATTAAAATGQKVTVTYMTWENNDTNASIDKAMEIFSKANPDIEVKRIASPSSDYGQKLSSMAQAKQLPDIFWTGNDTEQQFGAQGLLYDWTTQANVKSDNFDLSKFAPGAIDVWKTTDGKLYGLPTLLNTKGIWYNASLFTSANLPLPKTGWTYQEALAAAKALTTKDGSKTTRYGLWAEDLINPFSAANCAVSAGGMAFTDRINDTTKVSADDKFNECTRLLAEAVQAGSITPPGFANDNATEGFIAGQIPMIFGGQWLAPAMKKGNPSFKYGFAPMPMYKEAVFPLDSVGISSPKTIKNPEAVWKVTQFLATTAWESILPGAPVAPAAYVPASQPYFNTLKASGQESVAETVSYALQAPKKVGVRFNAVWASKASDVLKQYNDILLGKTPVDAGVKTMVQQLNDLIKANS